MTEAKKITVTLLGSDYTIVTDEPEDLVVKAAELIDTTAQEILAKSTHGVEPEKVAALILLQHASRVILQTRALERYEQDALALINLMNQTI